MSEEHGHIVVTVENKQIVRWKWQGGPLACISGDLLRDADEGVFSNRTPLPGDVFTVGPFTVRAVSYDEMGTLTVRREDYPT